ncbi:hypothetical protein HD806DRAFT_520126 [Xylariaceae sp. AK1471]|nr:hypothetical protein HD806DRAFT_520126 [Xylariaceae sp. AK1471]
MLAMTRLPSDSFLPSGSFDSFDSFDRSISSIPHLNGHSNSVISPLSLPHSIKQPSYFDGSNSRELSPPTYAHSPSLSGAPNSRQAPTTGSVITSPSMAPTNTGGMSPFGHLSPQTTATLLQRREEYSRRLQESWQAERAHLEANRARAEEMFREERALMDEERLIWAEQKTNLENEIMEWKQRTKAAESEVTRLTDLLNTMRGGASKVGGRLDGLSPAASRSPVGYRRSASSGSPGASDPSTAAVQTPSDGVSPGGRGLTVPESNPFEPLDPRMQSQLPENVSLTQERVPSIDIREVIPGLEGVRLRAPAIQKSTFNDANPLSPILSAGRRTPPNPNEGSSEAQSKISPAKMAQEALQAPEDHRLTMHAGHTPNHSVFFSQVPTIDSTAVNTAGSSGASTPTHLNEQKIPEITEEHSRFIPATLSNPSQETHGAEGLSNDLDMIEEAIFEPSDDDPELKGPLCLKNRPAADEIFLRRLSDKLEEVKANDATPSVLNDPVISELSQELMDLKPSTKTHDSTNDDDHEDSMEDVEKEIPLKLKKSSNFGLPLGQLGGSSG